MGPNPTVGAEERVKSFRASFGTFAPPFTARTILLRTESDRPAAFHRPQNMLREVLISFRT